MGYGEWLNDFMMKDGWLGVGWMDERMMIDWND